MTLNTYAGYLTYFTLKPRQKISKSDLVMVFAKQVNLRSGHIWTGYDQGSQFEAGVRAWLQPRNPATGSVMLGGTYLHKHNTGSPYGTAYQNDFYQLQQLRDLQPITVHAGSQITVDRDIFNIDQSRTFNAWDVELVIVVDE